MTNILLVHEDFEQIQYVFGNLTASGHYVDYAASVDEGLQCLDRAAYGLVVAECYRSAQNIRDSGPDFSIAERCREQDIPFVVLTFDSPTIEGTCKRGYPVIDLMMEYQDPAQLFGAAGVDSESPAPHVEAAPV